MSKNKTPKKEVQDDVQITPKSTKKNKTKEVQDDVQITPKSTKKNKLNKLNKMKTPTSVDSSTPVSSKKKNPELATVIKKLKTILKEESQIEEKIKIDGSPQKLKRKKEDKNEIAALDIQFPEHQCHKQPLLDVLNTDQPILLAKTVNLTLRYSDRYEALEAVERLKKLSPKVKANLKFSEVNNKTLALDKRLVHVPDSSDSNEAIAVLKKVFGAIEAEQKTHGNTSRMMLLSFATAEAARAADKITHKSYNGMELILTSHFELEKRNLEDDRGGNASKKMKRDQDDDEDMEEEDDDDDDSEDNEEESDEEMEVETKKANGKNKKVGAAQPEDDDDDDDDDDDEEDQDEDDSDDDSEE